MMLALRSLRYGLIAFPSNFLPILVMFGVMGGFGIRLDMLSSIAACLTLGIIVDDSIHFIFCFRKARSRGAGIRPGAARALRARVGEGPHSRCEPHPLRVVGRLKKRPRGSD